MLRDAPADLEGNGTRCILRRAFDEDDVPLVGHVAQGQGERGPSRAVNVEDAEEKMLRRVSSGSHYGKGGLVGSGIGKELSLVENQPSTAGQLD